MVRQHARPPGVRLRLVLGTLSVLLALLIVVPMPIFPLWLVHFFALETSLATAVLGLATLVAAWAAGRDRLSGALLGLPGVFAGFLPMVLVLPAYPPGRIPSLREYLFGVPTRVVRIDPNVVLDPGLSQLKADVYRGAGSGRVPFVVVVHGGSFAQGDKGEGASLSRQIAESGFSVFDVVYRLAPAHPFPEGIRDVKCLLGRLREQAAEWGIDPGRGALLGRSAGGEIALVAAYSLEDPRLPPSCLVPEQPVSAVVALYAPTDLAWGHDHPPRPDVIGGPKALEAYLGGTPAQSASAYELASPLSWASRPLPPTLIIHGSWDHIVRVEHARRLARGLERVGQRVELLLVPGAEHGFDLRPGGLGEQLARGRILDFLASALR